MRGASGLRAIVSRQSNYLTAGRQTGLTGVVTHPAPRPHLVWVYKATLDQLQQVPDTSVYRQSLEALTKHRLNIVESAIPEGYKEWKERVATRISQNPEVFGERGSVGEIMKQLERGRYYPPPRPTPDERDVEWDEEPLAEKAEGPAPEGQRQNLNMEFGEGHDPELLAQSEHALSVEQEPPLTTNQISEIEHKVGAGLIEEVIAVAEGEYHLVGVMKDAEIWNELVEKPAPNQWQYFQRDTHVDSTQSP